MISTNQFKNGTHIDVDGTIFKIVEFQHVKPGKGPAFVRTKLKRTTDGATIDKTFRAGEKFRPVRTETRKMQFLYKDGSDYVFMDTESYEQEHVDPAALGDAADYLVENAKAVIAAHNGQIVQVEIPAAVELTISETEPGVQGDRVSGARKPATLETGATVQVPLFVDIGDRVKVQTETGAYISRA